MAMTMVMKYNKNKRHMFVTLIGFINYDVNDDDDDDIKRISVTSV